MIVCANPFQNVKYCFALFKFNRNGFQNLSVSGNKKLFSVFELILIIEDC